mgnify:CR=1 FL=1
MSKFTVIANYQMEFIRTVEAKNSKEAIDKAVKEIGRDPKEYKKVDFEVEEDFI